MLKKVLLRGALAGALVLVVVFASTGGLNGSSTRGSGQSGVIGFPYPNSLSAPRHANVPAAVVVPSSPMGVPVPADGFGVLYADGFGSCIWQTNTQCSLGAARADNSWSAENRPKADGNSNEIASFVPGSVDITPAGLVESCTHVTALGEPYSCGAMLGLPAATSWAPKSPNPFTFAPGANRRYVIQFSWKLPTNQGWMDDPGVWSTGTNWNWEIDFPECWGMGQHQQQTGLSYWAGHACGTPAVPQNIGGSTNGGNVGYTYGNPWGGFVQETTDPAAGYQTETIDINENANKTATMTAYIDGVYVTSSTLSNFNSSVGKIITQNDLRLSTKCGCDESRLFPAGGNQLTIRYLEVFAPVSQGSAGTTGDQIVPGTLVG